MVLDFQKKNKQKGLLSILIVVDDLSDDPKFVRYTDMLHRVFTRGRHNAISTTISTQKYNVLARIIRVNRSVIFACKPKTSL